MQLELIRLRLLAPALLISAFFCTVAEAQMSTFAKTTQGGTPIGVAGAQKMEAWNIAVLSCDAAKPDIPCPPASEIRGFVAAIPSKVQAAAPVVTSRLDLLSDAKIDALAEASGNPALFKVPLSTGELTTKEEDGEQESASAASLEKLFQLSQTLDWRIEPGDMDGQNQVGVFTSRTLSQFGPNASIKFDSGVNVEAKTGTIAGKAGFAVAW